MNYKKSLNLEIKTYCQNNQKNVPNSLLMTSYLVYVYDMRLDLVDLDVLDNMTRQKMFFSTLTQKFELSEHTILIEISCLYDNTAFVKLMHYEKELTSDV